MTPRVEFSATVSEDGMILPEGGSALRARLARWKGRKVLIKVRPWQETRSGQQNRWYWGRIIPAARKKWSTEERRLSDDQAHYILKWTFLGTVETPMGPVPADSHDLSVSEFWDYCERICAHFAAEYGIEIPRPGEDVHALTGQISQP